MKVLDNDRKKVGDAASQSIYWELTLRLYAFLVKARIFANRLKGDLIQDERGDVPGWVLVVLMTTGLITAIWAIAEPRLSQLLRSSLDSMNSVR